MKRKGKKGTHHTRAGTSDLVGQMVGALVSTALVFEDSDAAYYDRLMTQALSLYGAGMRRRGKYSDVFLYDCAPRVRALKPKHPGGFAAALSSAKQITPALRNLGACREAAALLSGARAHGAHFTERLPRCLPHACPHAPSAPRVQDPTAVLPDPVTLACRPPDQQFAGSMVYWYNSTSYRDDLAWAASWMYRATRDQARAPAHLLRPCDT